MKVTSEALGMEEAAQRVSEAGATVTWDDTAKQNYAEWQEITIQPTGSGWRMLLHLKSNSDL